MSKKIPIIVRFFVFFWEIGLGITHPCPSEEGIFVASFIGRRIPLSGIEDPSSRCFAEAGEAYDKGSLTGRVGPPNLIVSFVVNLVDSSLLLNLSGPRKNCIRSGRIR